MVNVEYHDEPAREAIRRFNQLGDDLEALVTKLAGDLAGDSPWSQDKIGSAFGSKFDPQRSSVIGNAQDFAKRLASFGSGLTDAAARVTTADHPGDA